MKNDNVKLWMDQNLFKVYARNITELKKILAEHGIKGKVERIYIDCNDGHTYHTGYAIGDHWFECFEPVKIRQ